MKCFKFLCLLFILVSCNDEDRTLKKVFDDKQVATVDSIISYYDKFILQQTVSEKMSIQKAYLSYMQVNTVSEKQLGGNLDVFRPGISSQLAFFETLDHSSLNEIYKVGDLKEQEKSFILDYKKPSYHLNMDGKFMDLLRLLSKRNDFYKSYFEYVEKTGDIGPKCYGAILNEYYKFDFRKKEERFVFIVTMLRRE